MVERGIGNSRMKDYFDLWVLAGAFEFEGATLAEAIRAAFERRKTPLPVTVPVGLSEAFGSHAEKLAQWRAFVRRGKLNASGVNLPEVVARVRDFLMPLIKAIAADIPSSGKWKPGKGEWE
jgi:hypothetical protein